MIVHNHRKQAYMTIDQTLKTTLENQGVCDVGFCKLPDGFDGLDYAVSIVLPLSEAIIDEITDKPTYTYFHHYRTVNAYIDRLLLEAGLLLQQHGWRYIPIAASQSSPKTTVREHVGRYSHKKAAALAGMGTIGKSTLFLHHKQGPRVRLGTLLTNCPLPETQLAMPVSPCGNCHICVQACPAGAIKDKAWEPNLTREYLFDAQACNQYMRQHFMQIGRGSVCGICVKVCPFSQPEK